MRRRMGLPPQKRKTGHNGAAWRTWPWARPVGNFKKDESMILKLIQIAGAVTAAGCTCADRLGLAVAALAVAFAAVVFEEYQRQKRGQQG